MVTGEDPSVWGELRAQRDLLIEMKTKLELVPDHEIRIRKLEERRFPLQVVAVWVAAVSLVCTAVSVVLLFASK